MMLLEEQNFEMSYLFRRGTMHILQKIIRERTCNFTEEQNRIVLKQFFKYMKH